MALILIKLDSIEVNFRINEFLLRWLGQRTYNSAEILILLGLRWYQREDGQHRSCHQVIGNWKESGERSREETYARKPIPAGTTKKSEYSLDKLANYSGLNNCSINSMIFSYYLT